MIFLVIGEFTGETSITNMFYRDDYTMLPIIFFYILSDYILSLVLIKEDLQIYEETRLLKKENIF